MKRALVLILIAAPILLAASYPGRDAHSGSLYVISAIGWFGFLIAALALLVLSLILVVRRATQRAPSAERT